MLNDSRFYIGDCVEVLENLYGAHNIQKGQTLQVVGNNTLGEYWINAQAVEVDAANDFSRYFMKLSQEHLK